MYVFKNTTILAYKSNRFSEICILSKMFSYSIYKAMNKIPFYTEKPEVTKLGTIIETHSKHLKNTDIDDLLENFGMLEGIRDRVDKDSTPEEIRRYTDRDDKIVMLTEEYLTEGGSPDSRSSFTGSSLIDFAVEIGCVGLAQLLVYHGADVKYGPPYTPPLELAVMACNGHERIVRLLLDHGAHLPATDRQLSLQNMTAREYNRDIENIRYTVFRKESMQKMMDRQHNRDIKNIRGTVFRRKRDKEKSERILVMLEAEPARRVKESKREAFAMVLHKRLGAGSRVSELGPEVVRNIVDRAW
jgi:hypothetical protein